MGEEAYQIIDYFHDEAEELAYYNKIRKEMDDMKKEAFKKGIPFN